MHVRTTTQNAAQFAPISWQHIRHTRKSTNRTIIFRHKVYLIGHQHIVPFERIQRERERRMGVLG